MYILNAIAEIFERAMDTGRSARQTAVTIWTVWPLTFVQSPIGFCFYSYRLTNKKGAAIERSHGFLNAGDLQIEVLVYLARRPLHLFTPPSF